MIPVTDGAQTWAQARPMRSVGLRRKIHGRAAHWRIIDGAAATIWRTTGSPSGLHRSLSFSNTAKFHTNWSDRARCVALLRQGAGERRHDDFTSIEKGLCGEGDR